MDVRNKITGINEILKTKLHSYFAQNIKEPYYTFAQEILVPLYETISDNYNFFQFLKSPRSYYDVVMAFSDAWFEKMNAIYRENFTGLKPVDVELWSGYQQTDNLRRVFFDYFLENPFESGEYNETA